MTRAPINKEKSDGSVSDSKVPPTVETLLQESAGDNTPVTSTGYVSNPYTIGFDFENSTLTNVTTSTAASGQYSYETPADAGIQLAVDGTASDTYTGGSDSTGVGGQFKPSQVWFYIKFDDPSTSQDMTFTLQEGTDETANTHMDFQVQNNTMNNRSFGFADTTIYSSLEADTWYLLIVKNFDWTNAKADIVLVDAEANSEVANVRGAFYNDEAVSGLTHWDVERNFADTPKFWIDVFGYA